HTQRLEDRAHRAAGNDAGALRRRAHDDLAGTEAADDVVMQRTAFAQRHANQRAPRLFGRLADRLRHFARLTRAITDPALAVAHDDQRGKAEPPPALHDLGDAIDRDELLDELRLFAVASLPATVASTAAFPASAGAAAFAAPA